ncbi:MAG TPA: ATP-binding protein [Anaerolineaceae bacterium]|nr:ATP-binding protein [Anaerolineaceae bacterium]
MAVSRKNLSPEILVPKIGEYLVQKRLITLQDLNKALYIQYENAKKGYELPLGKILVDGKYISQEMLDEVITEQLINFRDALEQSNHQLERRVQQRTLELQEALNKVNELNQLKNNFISNISHELRTPLTHIKGYLDLLVSKDLGSLAEEQSQVLEIMGKATNRLERLIEDLIMFTFAEHEQILVSQHEFEIISTINEVTSVFQTQLLSLKIIFTLDPEIKSIFVHADQKKIAWVVNQLVENAIKFSKGETEIEISIIDQKDSVKISVKDNGIGIPENRIGEVFEPFHQLDSSSTRKAGGVGLGLALAKKIIEAHGSRLNVRSQVGIGSIFDFSLRKLIK